MAAAAPAVTTAEFDAAVLESETPVLVDFWATWCGPCKMVAPTVAAVAVERADKVKVVAVDIDAEPDLARRFNVMSVPTLLLFKGGEPVAKVVGARPKHALLGAIDAHLD